MQSISVSGLLASAALSLLAATTTAQDGMAHYRVTFQSTWSPATHPIQFPSNPHYSPLVGGLHNSNVEFWAPGGIATNGIEVMAESGAPTTFANEVQAAVNAGNASHVLNYGGSGALGFSPSQLSITFTAQPDFSELTLVTMLAPSPDWFVGLHGFDLMQNGDWIESAVVPLNLYDAGTDSGTTYNSGNANVFPHQPISLVTTSSGPFQGASTQVGTFTIERISSTLVFGCGNPEDSIGVAGNAELGQTLQFALMDPTGQLPTPAVSGLAISSTRDANFPCGTSLPGFGLGNGMPGEVLLGTIDGLATGPTFTGGSSVMFVTLPNLPALVGQEFYFQGLLASSRVGLTRGVAVRVGN